MKRQAQAPASSSHAGIQMDREYFNRYADGYSPYTPGDMELLLNDLVAEIRDRRVATICEVGSADGQFSAQLAKHLTTSASILGIDIADQVLRLFPFDRVCGNAFRMPLATNALDLVCYAATFHHLSPFPAALAEMNRVLAPGGLAYFLEPNYFHPQRRWLMSHSRLYHLYRKANDTPVNPDELVHALNELRMDVLSLRYINIHFKAPGLLQSTQNFIAQWNYPEWMRRYVMPWLVVVASKR